MDYYDRLETEDLIAKLIARDNLTELEHVLLDRLIRTVAALEG
jgi:hypothetical protein